jgi:hypothetical protein
MIVGGPSDRAAGQDVSPGGAKTVSGFFGPSIPFLGSAYHPSANVAAAEAPAKQYSAAVISIADYFPLNRGDYQFFEDLSSYSFSNTTYTLHGQIALLRTQSIVGVMSAGQYLSVDSAGRLLQHGMRMQTTLGWADAIFDRSLVWGTAGMTIPTTLRDSVGFTVEGFSGVVYLTLEYLGVDESRVIRTASGNFRRCVVIRETDRITIPSLKVDESASKLLYLAKRAREMALNDPSDSPLMTRLRVGNRILHPTLSLSTGARDAVAESNTIPTGQRMFPGTQRLATMTFRNRGILPWHPDDGFRLGALGDSDPLVAANRIFLNPGTTVLPGEAYTFSVVFTAPPTTGPLTTDWRMVQDGVIWFGESLVKTISILNSGVANLSLSAWDFAPFAPARIAPGDPFAFGTLLDNNGGAASGPFWFEVWGSRTGGLMLDMMLTDSAQIGPLAPGGDLSYVRTQPLYSIPDGPYTVVLVADRLKQVPESNERDNRAVIGSKRLLVLRPPTNADLAIENFTFSPNPAFNRQDIMLGGQVRNIGTQDTGPFWIEFWGSFDRVDPQLGFFLCDSINVPNLAPGAATNLAGYPRTLYDCPTGTFMVGVFADRPDQVNELDETNNYVFLDGVRLNQTTPVSSEQASPQAAGCDLVVVSADSSPSAPTQLTPGSTTQFSVRVENRGTAASGPFWLELWGSKLGGLSLDQFLADSERLADLPAGGAVDLNLVRSLYSIPDGPFTITVTADRPGETGDVNRANNKRSVARKRLLTIRPESKANLRVEALSLPSPISAGEPLRVKGFVRNVGTQASGPFWIEFWGSLDQDYPVLGIPLCDSIYVPNLVPDAAVNISSATYPRLLYRTVPTTPTIMAVMCFADRNDLVNETNEADNYSILRNYRVVQTNLVLDSFSFGPNPVRQGQALQVGGRVRNVGAGRSGPFWVEFWGGLDPANPTLDIQLCDSIYVSGLAPNATCDLTTPPLTLHTIVPPALYSVICYVDRIGAVPESNENDNSVVLPGYRVLPAILIHGERGEGE